MSKKLEILKQSLAKKEQELQRRFLMCILQLSDKPMVNRLNDKRNGQATLMKWEQQNDAIRTAKANIEKTKLAIEKEEDKIHACKYQNENFIPNEILELLEKGELIQWRKHPTHFFVPGVDKARIWWDESRKAVAHKYAHLITEQEQRTKFVRLYNGTERCLKWQVTFCSLARCWNFSTKAD
jgi:hypothetical protein